LPNNKNRQIKAAKAAYLRIKDKNFFNVINFFTNVLARSKVKLI
jgi:hypothetical protein